MNQFPEGNALVYCEKAFATTQGKTAHGLVRKTERYKVVSVIDSNHSGQDAGIVLEGKNCGTPIYASVESAFLESAMAGFCFPRTQMALRYLEPMTAPMPVRPLARFFIEIRAA